MPKSESPFEYLLALAEEVKHYKFTAPLQEQANFFRWVILGAPLIAVFCAFVTGLGSKMENDLLQDAMTYGGKLPDPGLGYALCAVRLIITHLVFLFGALMTGIVLGIIPFKRLTYGLRVQYICMISMIPISLGLVIYSATWRIWPSVF